MVNGVSFRPTNHWVVQFALGGGDGRDIREEVR